MGKDQQKPKAAVMCNEMRYIIISVAPFGTDMNSSITLVDTKESYGNIWCIRDFGRDFNHIKTSVLECYAKIFWVFNISYRISILRQVHQLPNYMTSKIIIASVELRLERAKKISSKNWVQVFHSSQNKNWLSDIYEERFRGKI